jgi:hypothetical protein
MESVNALRRSGKSGFIRAASGNTRFTLAPMQQIRVGKKLLQVNTTQLTGED